MAEIVGQKMCVNKWRNFFEGAEADICSVIEFAILVALSDTPTELRRRRDKIAESLYTQRIVRCCECESVADDDDDVRGSSCDEAEVLTVETEEDCQALTELFRIKHILANPDESATMLYDSLRILESMPMTFENLQATEIGKQVNRLRKHNSKEVRSLVQKLVSNWKDVIDEWLKSADNAAAAAIAGTLSVSVSPSTVDYEDGLPCPPLEEVAFLTSQTALVEISQILDDMDDDGNLCVLGNHQGKMLSNANRMMNSCGPRRSPVATQQQKACADTVLQNSYFNKYQNKPSNIPSQNKFSPSDMQIKFEEAKRKFNEGYQIEEKAKKQRTIQVLELKDLPKQTHHVVRQARGKPVPQHHCQWGGNRRY